MTATGEYNEAQHPEGVMRAMWLTPLYSVSLGSSMPPGVNHKLAEFALETYVCRDVVWCLCGAWLGA